MIWWLLIGIGVLLCLLGLGIGNFFFHMAIERNKKGFIQEEPRVGPAYDWFHQASGYEEVSITSKDGLRLHAYLIKAKPTTTAFGIIIHGYGGNATMMAPAAQRFYEQGYGVLLCDLRAHGKSEGNVIGFGGKDSEDILTWSNYLVSKHKAETIFLYGVSMGAASVMMCADRVAPQVRCVIEDCGFASLKQQVSYLLDHQFHYPKALVLPCANIVMKFRAHYQMKDVEPWKHVAKAKVPMLFIHGDKDDFVPFFMLDEVYKVCPTPKQKVIIVGAGHGKCRHVDPQRYWDSIDSWVKRYMK